MRPHLFLFDIDGTLVHLRGAGRRALENAFGEVFDVPDPRQVLEPIAFDGRTDQGILAEAMRRAGIEPDRFAARRARLEEVYLQDLRDRLVGAGPDRILPGVLPLLETLVSRGAALGLLTGNLESGARVKLAPFDLNRFFPAGAFGSDHADRTVLAGLALQRMEAHAARSFAPEEVVVIGDSIADVRCGKAHRFHTVAVTTGWTRRESLAAENPDLLLEDLTHLLPRISPD